MIIFTSLLLHLVYFPYLNIFYIVNLSNKTWLKYITHNTVHLQLLWVCIHVYGDMAKGYCFRILSWFYGWFAFSSGMLILICTNCLKSTTHTHSYMTTINFSIPYLPTINVWVNPLGFQGCQNLVVSLFVFIFFTLICKVGFGVKLVVNFPSMFHPYSLLKPFRILTMEPLIQFKDIRVEIVDACDECANLSTRLASGIYLSCFRVIVKGLSRRLPLLLIWRKPKWVI